MPAVDAVSGIAVEKPGGAGYANTEKLGAAGGGHADQFGGEVRAGGGGGGIQRHAGPAKKVDCGRNRSSGVDEQVVAQFKRRLVEGTTETLRTAGRGDRHFRIIDKDVTRLFAGRGKGRQRAVPLARVGTAAAVQIERTGGLRRPFVSGMPFVSAHGKVPYPRLLGELTGVLQPVVEPTQQEVVRVEIRRRTQTGLTRLIAPRNVDPRPGEQILMVPGEWAAGTGAQRLIAGDGAFEIEIVPAGDVQCGGPDLMQAGADIEFGPECGAAIAMEYPIAQVAVPDGRMVRRA